MLFKQWMTGFLREEAEENGNNGGGGQPPVVESADGAGAPGGGGAEGAPGESAPADPAGGAAGEGEFPGSVEEYAKGYFDALELGDEDRGVVSRFRESAFAARVSPEAFERMAGDMVKLAAQNAAAFEEAQVAAANSELKSLKERYGAKFDAVSELVNNTVTNLAHAAGVSPTVFNDPAIKNNPEVFAFFAHLGQVMAGSGFAAQTNAPAVVSASQELHEIYYGSGDKNRAFFDADHADHKRVNERVNYLLSIGGRVE